jgi:hypothetical protein
MGAWISRQESASGAIKALGQSLPSPEIRWIAALVLLVAMLSAAELVRGAQNWLLRLMEGYWPDALRSRHTERVRARLQKHRERWQQLDGTSRNRERWEFVRLDRKVIKLHPPQDSELMPTALGNRLRAAEQHSHARYGLDAVTAFPRLWPLLPDCLREDLAESREGLNAAVRLFAWGLLSLVWCLWAWWVVLIAVAMMWIAWRRVLDAAEAYGDLLRASFDLYRFDLYRALRWPLPSDTETERAHGERLTVYLYRGLTSPEVVFTEEKTEPAG